MLTRRSWSEHEGSGTHEVEPVGGSWAGSTSTPSEVVVVVIGPGQMPDLATALPTYLLA